MKVLIVKTSSMGDVIHTLPAISDVKTVIPEIEFDWVVEESFAEIPNWHQAVKKVIPIALRRWRKNLFQAFTIKEIQRFIKNLRAEQYDYIIDAQGLIKSALITALTRGNKCGLDFNSVREPLASFVYGKKIAIAKGQHAINRNRELFARVLDYDLAKMPLDYGIKQFVAIPQAKEKYLVFVHGSSHPSKCWENYKWIELAKLVGTKGFAVKLPWGSEAELKRAQEIAADCNHVQVLPKSSLYDLARVFLESSGVIAVDTGLGHLAAALAVPTVSLYQATNPELIGTVGTRCGYIQNMTGVAVSAVWEKIESMADFGKFILI